jgi:DNA invertase Pin-like site-specific DNA recombinase
MKTTEKEKNVYVYRRWSTDLQTAGDSGRRQSDRAQQWCKERGLTITAEETDDGTSAYRGRNRRKGSPLDRLIQRLKPTDYLVVEDIDRLTRQDWLTGSNLVADIVDRGARLVTLDNGNEIDAERFRRDPGCFLPAILRNHLGHDEDNKKANRARESWAARMRALGNGTAANLHLPCWLRWNYEVNKPELDPHNAPVVARMFRLALEGHGCGGIARKLTEAGEVLIVEGKRKNGTPRCKGGKTAYELVMSGSYVLRTLRNKLCCGYGSYVEDAQAGTYPAVVDERTFLAVQQALRRNKNQTVALGTNTSNLFRGVIRCARCGGTLCSFSQRRNGKRYSYLTCSNSLHKSGKCGSSGVPTGMLESAIFDFLGQVDVIRPLLNQQKPSKADGLRGKLALVEQQIERAATVFWTDGVPAAIAAKLNMLQGEKKSLLAEIEAEAVTGTASITGYEQLLLSLPARLKDAQARERLRQALGAVVEQISTDPRGDGAARGWPGAWQVAIKLRGFATILLVEVVREGGWRLAGVGEP